MYDYFLSEGNDIVHSTNSMIITKAGSSQLEFPLL